MKHRIALALIALAMLGIACDIKESLILLGVGVFLTISKE